MKEGTIIGFRIIVDADGMLMTEFTELPDKDINKVFKQEENQVLIRAAIRSFKEIIEDIHTKLEREIDAIIRFCSPS